MITEKYLFLDDIRIPRDAFNYTCFIPFLKMEWDIVRNYTEFVDYIKTTGLLKFISFDHDLADTHYTPEHLWTDYYASKEWQDNQVHTEKTGYHCALWLVDFCVENNLSIPQFYCHSQNPVGKDKIIGLLENFIKHQSKTT